VCATACPMYVCSCGLIRFIAVSASIAKVWIQCFCLFVCDRKVWNYDAATACCFITTTHPRTLPWKPQSLLPRRTWLSFPIVPTIQT
jgi:hypothetical protein